MSCRRRLTLFIPGLFGPVSHTLPAVMPEIPAIERSLRFGMRQDINTLGFTQTLFQLFGFPAPEYDYPVAAVTHLVDNDHEPQGIWMRADPVHLRTERDTVVLLDNASFHIDKHEALVLAAELQQVFIDRGFQLEAPTNHRWYVKLEQLPRMMTTPIHEVVGKNIDLHAASGEHKTLWAQLSNEAQMSLYKCPLNDEREQHGKLPVNGLWLWGAGALPKTKKRIWSQVFADEVTTQGLSMLTTSPYAALPDSLEELVHQSAMQEDILAVISSGLSHQHYFDQQGWQDFIRYLEEKWFAKIETLIKHQKLHQLTLLTDNNKLSLTRTSYWKLWRQGQPFITYKRHALRN